MTTTEPAPADVDVDGVNPTRMLRVDPDGSHWTFFDPNVGVHTARAQLQELYGPGADLDLMSLSAPLLAAWPADPDGVGDEDEDDNVWLGMVHEWGYRLGLPLNHRAWMLYGRSPVFGPMWMMSATRNQVRPGVFERVPMPDDMVAAILRPEAVTEYLEAMRRGIDASEYADRWVEPSWL